MGAGGSFLAKLSARPKTAALNRTVYDPGVCIG